MISSRLRLRSSRSRPNTPGYTAGPPLRRAFFVAMKNTDWGIWAEMNYSPIGDNGNYPAYDLQKLMRHPDKWWSCERLRGMQRSPCDWNTDAAIKIWEESH